MGVYVSYTKEELQDELDDRGLHISGTKSELVARLEADDEDAEEDDQAQVAPVIAPPTVPVVEGDYGFVGVDSQYNHKPASIHFSPNPQG